MYDPLEIKFEKIGARLKVKALHQDEAPVRIDIKRDERGEYFDLRKNRGVQIDVIDLRPRERHLLLLVREDGNQKSKFLCGHDERAWFVAAIPEVMGVRNVETAMVALQPAAVREALDRANVARNKRFRRRNEVFVRQGEWFFIPEKELIVDGKRVLKNEPIRRGAGKPHWCQYLYRLGGQRVHVCAEFPNGLTHTEFAALSVEQRKRSHDWRVMARDARVYVRGSVSHSDHATIYLDGWHRVEMNTETRARAMRHVAFRD